MKKNNKKNKKGQKENFSFGQASVLTICVLFFLSIAFISACFLSQSATEKYAQVKVAEARGVSGQKLALLETGSSRKAEASIAIGEGVMMSDGCSVSQTGIVCY